MTLPLDYKLLTDAADAKGKTVASIDAHEHLVAIKFTDWTALVLEARGRCDECDERCDTRVGVAHFPLSGNTAVGLGLATKEAAEAHIAEQRRISDDRYLQHRRELYAQLKAEFEPEGTKA